MSTTDVQRVGETSRDFSESVAPKPSGEREPAEVLFPEAKRRERHRRLIVLAIAVFVIGGIGRYDLKLWITHPFGGATYLPR
jgi:hypothetical protein